MKKSSLGLAAIALCLGLTACDNDERVSETDDLNRLESPAAGSPQDMPPEEPATQPSYGTGTEMGTQPPDDSAAMPGAENPPEDIRQGGETPQQ